MESQLDQSATPALSRREVAKEPTYDRAALDHLIHRMGVRYRQEILRPIGPTPTRLPVNQSFSLAATHLFFSLPDHVRRFLSRTTPHAAVQKVRQLDSRISPLAIWMLGYHFLVGREILLDFSVIKASDHAEDIAVVLDCWRQCAMAARTDGHTDSSEAGGANHYLPSETIQQLYTSLIPVDAEMRRVAAQCLTALESYTFILNAEAHLGTVDSGPYPLSTNRVLVVRHFFDLTARWYPWHSLVDGFPYPACILAFTLDPSTLQTIEISDRATLVTAPKHYYEHIQELVLVSLDRTRLSPLPFTELDRLTRSAKKLERHLLAWFQKKSAQSAHQTIVSCAQPWAIRPSALVVPSDECFDWAPAPAARELLSHYEQDDALAARWATQRCLAPGRQSAFASLNG